MSEERIVLTRETLYEQVWKEPTVRVASRLGLSGRGLGKLCARYQIPVPPRGWWASKQHGYPVQRIPLPPGSGIQVQIVFQPGEINPAHEEAPEVEREKDPAWLISVPEDLAITHPLVKQAAAAIRKASREFRKNDVVRWQDRYQAKLRKPPQEISTSPSPDHRSPELSASCRRCSARSIVEVSRFGLRTRTRRT